MKWLWLWLWLCWCLLGATLAYAAPPVAAADDMAGAKSMFREGRRLYEVGDYRPAFAKFKAAYLSYDRLDATHRLRM